MFKRLILTMLIVSLCGNCFVYGYGRNSKASFIREGIVRGPLPGDPNSEDEIFRSLAVAPDNPDLVYVGSEGCGIFKSSDGGDTWTWLRNGLLYAAFNHPSYAETYDLCIDPTDKDTVYWAATGSPGPATGDYPSSNAGVYKSIDGGEQWTRKIAGLTNSSVGSIAMADSTTIYIGVNGGVHTATGWDISGRLFEGGIYKSVDAGESWTKLTLPEPDIAKWSDFWRIVIRGTTIYALGQKDEEPDKGLGLVKSTDEGVTWTRINSPSGSRFTSFDVSSDGKTIYAVDHWSRGGKIYRSTDGGARWKDVTPKGIRAYGPIRISPHDSTNKTVFFTDRGPGNQGRLYRSTNGLSKNTIVLTVTAGLQPNKDISDIEFTSDKDIIYVGAKGLLIYKSNNGGKSFTLKADLREYIDSH